MGAVVIAIGVEHDHVVRFVLHEAGRIVDEYLSVPEYYGEVPPGDVISLAANPTVVARLTGADPAEVRRVIVNGKSPEELPPADELAGAVGSLLGVEGGDHGYEGAGEIPDAVDIPRE
jgi:hypothetical protein